MKRIVLLLGATLAVGVMAHSGLSTTVSAQASALEKNKILAQRFHLDMIAKQNLAIADEIIAPDCVIHMPSDEGPPAVKGPARAKEIAAGDHKAFPKGIELVHDYVLAEGDLVAFHWSFVGTRESGEKRTLYGIDMVRIANGKIAEMWIEYHPFPPRPRASQQQ